MQRSMLSALVLGAMIFSAACAAPPPPESEPSAAPDPAGVDEVRNRYAAGYEAGDAAALAALFAEDAVTMPDHSPTLEGRAAMQQYFEGLFAQYTGEITISPIDTEISGDIAHEHGTFAVTLTPKAGGDPVSESGRYLVILKRQADGSWLLHHDIDNTTVPAPAAPAP